MLTWDYYLNEFEINVLGGASTAKPAQRRDIHMLIQAAN